MDELAFVDDLPAHGRKTFQITLSSEKSTKTYPERVYAKQFTHVTAKELKELLELEVNR